MTLVLIALLLSAVSGLPSLLPGRRAAAAGRRVSLALCLLASGLGVAGAVWALIENGREQVLLPGRLFAGGAVLELDALSAFFLVPVFLVSGLGAAYARGYWRPGEQRLAGSRSALLWGIVTAGMAVLLLARQSVLFMTGWELMALASFFLICIEGQNHEAGRAAWIYLIATHVGSLCLIAMFGLLRLTTGSLALQPLQAGLAGPGMLAAIFLLALVGFGLKAGIVPLHFWLPGAHANAPSHISAFLSGVILKMGIYGLVRVCGLLPEPPLSWAGLLLFLGVAGGVLGLGFALAQHDLKRALAYSSVENIGIILLGLALALAGRSLQRPDLIALGMGGAMFHVWNHSLFKSLLFFCAGSVVHATGTREIDRLGGLGKKMPWTAGLFLTGAVAVCGLPPLNGFAGELLLYIGLLRSAVIPGVPAWTGAALAAPALALIGALALACFVKLYGIIFLGLPRSEPARQAHEAPASMRAAMTALAGLCALTGVLAYFVAPVLDRVAAAWVRLPGASSPDILALPGIAALAGLKYVSMAAAVLAVLLLAGALLLRRWAGRLPERARRPDTWGCGYPYASARVQYTASSFTASLAHWFRTVLRPQTHAPELAKPFALPAGFRSHVGDVVLERVLLPLAHRVRAAVLRLHGLQQGLTHYYLVYILLAVVAMLLWTMPLGDFFASLLTR